MNKLQELIPRGEQLNEGVSKQIPADDVSPSIRIVIDSTGDVMLHQLRSKLFLTKKQFKQLQRL